MDRTHHDENFDFEAPEPGVPAGMEMDNRIMWALVACCLAIPAALILGVIAGGRVIGAGGWMLLVAGALAVVIVIARKWVVGSHRRSRSDVDG